MKARCVLVVLGVTVMLLVLCSCGRSRPPVPVRPVPPSAPVAQEKVPVPSADKAVVEEQQPAKEPVTQPPPSPPKPKVQKPPPVARTKTKTMQGWMREIQGILEEGMSGDKWSFDWELGELDVKYPSVKIEVRRPTKRSARDLARKVGKSFLSEFPKKRITVSVYDWDTLEKVYWDTYLLK